MHSWLSRVQTSLVGFSRRHSVLAIGSVVPKANCMAEFIYTKCQAIDGHSQLLVQECCYHCPAGSRQLHRGPLLQLPERESDHTAHEEERCTLTTHVLQWCEQEPIDNADGLTNYNYIHT